MNLKQENKTKRKRKDQSKCRIYWRILTVYGYLIDFCNTRNSFFFVIFAPEFHSVDDSRRFICVNRQSTLVSSVFVLTTHTHTNTQSLLLRSQYSPSSFQDSNPFGLESHPAITKQFIEFSLVHFWCICVLEVFLIFFFRCSWVYALEKNDYIFVML